MRWHKAVWADREQAMWKHAWRNARATIHPVDVLARLLLMVPVSTAVISARNLADKLAKADRNLAFRSSTTLADMNRNRLGEGGR
jgi:hypothetical protein